MLLSEAVDQFIQWRESEAYSKQTIDGNRKHLYRIIDIVGNVPIEQFDATAYDKVQATEAKRGLAPGTLNNIQSTVRAFTKWAHTRGIWQPFHTPVAGRRYRPDPPKEKRMLSLSQFPVLLDNTDNPRDRVLIALALFTMCRQSELLTLRIKDVDLESGTLYVRVHKSYTDDRMPISSELDEELRRWLTYYTEECGPLNPDWYLVPARENDGFTTRRLVPTRQISKSQPILQRSLKAMGITPKPYEDGMHLLRRSAARRLYDELVAMGYDGAMRQVQTWLHHSSVTITERYLGLTVDRDTRDKAVRGQAMFPSLKADNVVELEVVRGSRNTADV